MALTNSQPNNINVPNGNGLVVYLDGETNQVYVRDVRGATEELNVLTESITDIIAEGGLTALKVGSVVTMGTDSNIIQLKAEKGQPNGYASLDSNGKLPVSQLPTSVLTYEGMWNAATNTPFIQDGTGDAGDFYIVSVAGTQDLGSGPIRFEVSDWVIYNGSIWQRNSSELPDLQEVTDVGAVTTNAITTGGITTDYVQLDLTATPTLTVGMARWNPDQLTWEVGIGSGPLAYELGQSLYYPQVRNVSGTNLPKGTLVMVNPADVSTGDRLNVIRAIADGSYPTQLFVGILAEAITSGQTGFAIWFGQVYNASQSAINLGGETWAEGNILYADPAHPGGLTNVEPSAPNHKVTIAAIQSVNGGNVNLLVRPWLNEDIGQLNDVSISSPVDNSILQFNSTTGAWENVAGTTTNIAEGTNLYFTTARARESVSAGTGISYDSGTGVITNSDRGSSQDIFKNIAVATQSTITADSNNDTLTLAAGTNIGITTNAGTDTITFSTINVPTGTGVANYIPLWTSSSNLSTSLLYDNGQNIGLNTALPFSLGANTNSLTIQGTNGSAIELQTSNVGGLRLASSATGSLAGEVRNFNFDLYANAQAKLGVLATGTIRLYDYGTGAKTGTPAYNLFVDASGNLIEGPGGVIDGGGTANYIPLWTDSNTIANSIMYEASSKIGINTITPGGTLHVYAANSGASLQYSGTLIVESAGPATIQLLSVNTQSQALNFGDAESGNIGRVEYSHLVDELRLYTNNTSKLEVTSTGTIQLTSYGGGTKSGTAAYNLAVDASGNIIETAGGVIDGSGTTNYVSKFTDSNTISDSLLYDNAQNTISLGTTSPLALTSSSRLIQVQATDVDGLGMFVAASNGGTVKSYFFSDSTTGTIGTQSNHPFAFVTNSTTRMTLTTAGRLGIGTATPATALDVQGSATIRTRLSIGGDMDGVASSVDMISMWGAAGGSRIKFGVNGTFYGYLSADTTQMVLEQSTGKFLFSKGASFPMYLDNGNVGVNTTTLSTTSGYKGITISGTTGSEIFLKSGATVNGRIAASASGLLLSSQTANPVIIDTTSANIATFKDSGVVQLNSYGSGTNTGTAAYNLAVDSSGNIIETAGGVVDGSGTTNYITKWTDSNTIGNSLVFDDGSGVGIGTTTPSTALQVVGTITATTFAGDLNGTINSATTGFTQATADNSTKMATTAFVKNVLAEIPAGLSFQGTWNASTNTPTLTSGVGTPGYFYIVSVAGTTNLDGITDWEVGDWAVFVEAGGTDTWQKVDNSSVLDGSGTGGFIAQWAGAGTSKTLTDSLFYSDGTNYGLGTTSPFGTANYRALTIGGTTGSEIYLGTTSTAYARLQSNSSAFTLTSQTGIPIQFGTNGTASMILTNDGKLGLNTLTPNLSTASSYGMNIHAPTGEAKIKFTNGNAAAVTDSDGGQIFQLATNLTIENLEADDVIFRTNGQEVMRIQNEVAFDIPNLHLIVAGTTQAGYGPLTLGTPSREDTRIQFLNSVTGVAGLNFGTTTGTNDNRFAGFIRYDHTTDSLTFGTNTYPGLVMSADREITLNSYGYGTWTGTVAYNLAVDSNGKIIETPGAVIDGSGTTNYVAKFTDSNTIGNSQVFDNGTNVGIGTTTPDNVLDLGSASQGRALTWESYSNVFSAYSSGNLVLAQNFYGDTATDTYKTSLTASYGAAGILISGTAAGLNGVMRFYVDNAAAKTAGAAFTPTERMQISGNGAIKFSTYGLGTFTGTAAYNLAVDASGNIIETAGAVIDGSGTTNYVAKFTDSNTIGNSQVFDNGTNVGIGNATPGQKLDITGNARVSSYYLFNGNPGNPGDSTASIYDQAGVGPTISGLNVAFRTGSTPGEAMRIASDGNVSIGTTANPGSRTNIYLSEAGALPNAILRLQNTGSQYLAKMIITDGNTNDAVIGYQGGVTAATQYLGFGLGTAITQMVLNGSGNVGIGTTTPQLVGAAWTTLEVQGQSTGGGGIVYTANNGATVKSHFYTDGTSGFVGTQTNHYFGFTTNNQERARFTAGGNFLVGSLQDYTRLTVSNGNSTRTGVTLSDANTSSLMLFAGASTIASINFDTYGLRFMGGSTAGVDNGTEIMRLTTSYNVLIGTTTDAGFKLQVNGTSAVMGGNQLRLYRTDNATYGSIQYLTGAGGFKFDDVNADGYTFAQGANVRLSIGTTGGIRFNAYGSGTFTGTPAYNLGVDSSGNVIELPGGVVDGSGTANKISKWQDANTLTDANITDNGSTVRINSLPLMADSRLAVGTAGADQTYASVFIGGNLTEGSSQYALLLDPQLDGTTNYGMLSNARIAANVTATTAYGIYQLNNELLSGATVENNFGIYIANQTSGTTQNWNLYSVTGKNYFGGNVLIGTTTDGGYKLRVNGTGRYDDYLQLWSGTAGASPRLIFGGETTQTDKSIFLESYYMVFQGHNNEGFKFQTTSSLGAVSNRMSILGNGTVVLSNYGSGSKTGTVAYNLAVDASGNVIETAGGVVDGSGTANYVTKWQDANTVTDSQIVDNGTNVGINNASPKTKLDVNGAIGFGSKTLNISDTFVTVLTVNMSNHTGCYVKITAFGDWSGHSAVAYLGEFFLQNGASAYNEPGVIIRQVDNTNTDDIVAQIVDPAGTGTRDFEIQLKTTSASGVPFSAAIQYEVRGQYNSVS